MEIATQGRSATDVTNDEKKGVTHKTNSHLK
jgi:hypothetical protein